MSLQSIQCIWSASARLVVLILIALVIACSGNNDTGPNGPEVTADQQRYQLFRGLLVNLFAECGARLDNASANYLNPDSSAVPGLNWPVVIPELPREYISHNEDGFAIQGRQDDSILRLRSAAYFRLRGASYWYTLTYHYEEIDQSLAELWMASIEWRMSNIDRDTIDARMNYSARQAIEGLCWRNRCQDYSLRIDVECTPELLEGSFEPYRGGSVSGVFEETATAEALDSELMITWYVNGTVLSDGRLDIEVTSGTFFVRDTLDFCCPSPSL